MMTICPEDDNTIKRKRPTKSSDGKKYVFVGSYDCVYDTKEKRYKKVRK
jgi:hypothetical protein